MRWKEQRMSDPAVVDGIGFAAAGLVLATFCMRAMTALRWVAIASNLAFIAYGYLGNLPPVLLLHLLLLPINICRLTQLRQRPTGATLAPYIRAPGHPAALTQQPLAKGGSCHEQPRATCDHLR